MLASSSKNQTTQCEKDFDTIVQAISKRETWALKVFDAWGKPIPSGILKGNVYWVGDYDECLQPMYLVANKSFSRANHSIHSIVSQHFSETLMSWMIML